MRDEELEKRLKEGKKKRGGKCVSLFALLY